MANTSGSKHSNKSSDSAMFPKVHKLPLTGATNMQKGSDGAPHHPNGEHKATNSTTGTTG